MVKIFSLPSTNYCALQNTALNQQFIFTRLLPKLGFEFKVICHQAGKYQTKSCTEIFQCIRASSNAESIVRIYILKNYRQRDQVLAAECGFVFNKDSIWPKRFHFSCNLDLKVKTLFI